jgi:hypothetical protein
VSQRVAELPDGILAFVKRDCPTCALTAPVLAELAARGVALTVYSQDDPAFPPGVAKRHDDRELEWSWRLGIEAVPTLVRVDGGVETGRAIGWVREEWEALAGVAGLGAGLPGYRPGCGSKSVEPGVAERLAARFGGERLRARRVELAPGEDEWEAAFERGWSDGLPLVPPTPERVLRMLEGARRDPGEEIGSVPPDLVPCTVEKVAINAVMAGCKPEHLPVVLAAVEAALQEPFCMHGLLATTWFSGPLVVVNGPIARAIEMNSGMNALGQGNRANAAIGRALQLVVRNVGGGKPGGVDRATLGWPGKLGFCFAEDEDGSPWEPLSVERGIAPGTSAVTLFAAGGLQGILDQQSRTPESLAASFAACLRAVVHPKLPILTDAMLVVCPEHARVFREAGWSKAVLRESLAALLRLPGREIVRGAGGIAEGMPAAFANGEFPKFRDGGLLIVHAGGRAGMFSAILAGWPASGPIGSSPVTLEVRA